MFQKLMLITISWVDADDTYPADEVENFLEPYMFRYGWRPLVIGYQMVLMLKKINEASWLAII